MIECLKPFINLPESYVVLDTETTGLPDNDGPPGIVTLGITEVDNRSIADSVEYKLKPYRPINREAQEIHGISDEEANSFPDISSKWPKIQAFLDKNCIVIHNASFDWPIIEYHIDKFNLAAPGDISIFCSQKSAIRFAEEKGIPMSTRGPSLDSLTAYLNIDSLRVGGIHGAEIDTRQTALVVEGLRTLGETEEC